MANGFVAERAGATPLQYLVVPSPNGGSLGDGLSGVSCTGPNNCMAVGNDDGSANVVGETLAESWDGSTWSIVSTPNPTVNGESEAVLNAVSCTEPDNCIAVGFNQTFDSQETSTLIESWDGSTWSIVPNPNAANSNDSGLNSVSCTGPNNCMAVGSFGSTVLGDIPNQTLVESWDGSTWSVLPSPNPDPNFNALTSVSCTAANSCMAVGYVATGAEDLALSWDGTSWSVLPTPDPGSRGNYLDGVSCIDANDCMAVGDYINTGSQNQTLVESWNGSDWSIVPSPSPGITYSYLDAVSCVDSLSGCVAVGIASTGSVDQTLVESDTGGIWSVIPSANNGGTNNDLAAISCSDSSTCAAAGDFVSGTFDGVQPVDSTLVLTNYSSPPSGTPEAPATTLFPIAGSLVVYVVVVFRGRRKKRGFSFVARGAEG